MGFISKDQSKKRIIAELRKLKKPAPDFLLIKNRNNLLKIMASQPIKRQRVECWSRIVGYLSPISRWNAGKIEEWKQRLVYSSEKIVSSLSDNNEKNKNKNKT